jgi:hypothetical protein
MPVTDMSLFLIFGFPALALYRWRHRRLDSVGKRARPNCARNGKP